MPKVTLPSHCLLRTSTLRSILAAAIALALVALLLSRFFTATHAAVAVEHQQKSVVGSLVGHSAPDFAITLWNSSPGETIHLLALRGRVVVVNFWASWCDPCHDEAPVLVSVAKSHAAEGVVFLGVALETDDSDGLAFIRQYHLPYDCGPASDSVAVAYGLVGIPVTVTINAKGVIVGQIDGPVTSTRSA